MTETAADRGRREDSPAPASGSPRALSRLLGSTPVAEFGSGPWGREAFVRTAADGPDLRGLFTLADADELLSTRALRTPFLRIAKDGAVQPESAYTRGGGVGAGIRDQVDPDRVARLLADGCTVVFQGLHRAWPAVVDFAGTLTTEVGHPVQVNAYLTPPTARGFAAHYDTHDVFIVQTAGDKRWQMHRPVVDDPATSDHWTAHKADVAAATEQPPALDHVLSPGDVLYLPRGWIHAAQAQDDMSLHLTIGVHPYTRRHVAQAMVAQLLEAHERQLERSLPLGIDVADPVELSAAVDEVRALFAAAVPAMDVADVSRRLERRRADDTRPAPLRPVQQARALASTGALVVRARAGVRLRLEESVDGLALVVDGRRVELPADCAAAVKALLTAPTVATADLPGLDPDAARSLVTTLLREGAVVPA
jgi:bifunctional lysine-specific demethylase and histidyl-hydroxylase NO66